MSLFWIFSAVFSLLAIAFIVYPLRQSFLPSSPEDDDLTDGGNSSRHAQNVRIYEERLDALKTSFDQGEMDESEFKHIELELKRELLIDVDGPSEETRTPSPSAGSHLGFGVVGAVSLFVLASTYALYFKWGAYDLQAQHDQMRFTQEEAAIAQNAAEQGDMEALVEQLHAKLKTAPDNIEGWALLGRTSMNMQNYDLAIESFQMVARSLERQSQNPAPFYGMIAQAYYFKGGANSVENYSADVESFLNLALRTDPNETNAIGLKAIMAFEQGNYPVAIQEWQKLLEIDPEHESGHAIRAGIARARGLLAIHESSKSMPSESPQQELALDDTAPGIPVVVSLSDALKDQVSDTDTVFVFAKAIQGPPMPLAAARAQVKDLPLSVRLDKFSAMMPSLTIETVDEVSLTARISKSGQPTAQAGDLYVSLGNVSVTGHDSPIQLEISTVF